MGHAHSQATLILKAFVQSVFCVGAVYKFTRVHHDQRLSIDYLATANIAVCPIESSALFVCIRLFSTQRTSTDGFLTFGQVFETGSHLGVGSYENTTWRRTRGSGKGSEGVQNYVFNYH